MNSRARGCRRRCDRMIKLCTAIGLRMTYTESGSASPLSLSLRVNAGMFIAVEAAKAERQPS